MTSATSKKYGQVIKDPKGKALGVFLTMTQYEQIMEDLHDISLMAERAGGPTISIKEMERRLKKDGVL